MVLVALLSLSAMGTVGCGPTYIRPLDLVEAASEVPPEWLKGHTGQDCPRATTCVVGRATAIDSKSDAVRAARVDGYLQLAEQAFPVHVAQQYQSQRRTADREVLDQTESRVLGRLQGARVLNEYWAHRREYQLHGQRDVFDAWALVALDTERMGRLYEDEQRRSKAELASLDALLATATQRVDTLPMTPALFLETAARCREAATRLKGMQDVDGRSLTQDVLAGLVRTLDRALTMELAHVRPGAGSPETEVEISALVHGVPVPGLGVDMARGAEPETVKAATTQGGSLSVAVPMPSRLRSSSVRLAVEGLPEINRTIEVPARVSCARLTVNVRAGAQADAELLAGVRRRLSALEAELGRHAPLCSSDAGPTDRPAVVVLSVAVNLGGAGRMGQRVSVVGGQASVALELRGSGGLNESIHSSGPTPVRGVGLSFEQIRSGLEESIVDVVREAAQAGFRSL